MLYKIRIVKASLDILGEREKTCRIIQTVARIDFKSDSQSMSLVILVLKYFILLLNGLAHNFSCCALYQSYIF